MYDFVIVGGGSAGCVMANRLSAWADHSVLLLEAGRPDDKLEIRVPAAFSKLFRSEVDWNYTTEPQPHMNGRRLYWPRGKVLGGSSAMNAMIHIRGNRADYDGWAALGNSGWTFEDVLPYFKRIEHYYGGVNALHSVGGPVSVERLRDPRPLSLAFVEAAEQTGIPRNTDFNGDQQDGAGLYDVTMKDGARISAATAYLKPVQDRPNLTVQTDTHVIRLEATADGRMTRVIYQQGDLVQQVIAQREVILAAGAVNSPQILMMSGIGPGESLTEMAIPVHVNLPGVGQNLQDHLIAGVSYHATQPLSLADAEKPGNLIKYLMGRVGPLTSNVAEGGAFIRTQPDFSAPDIQYHFGPNFFVDHGQNNPPGHGFSLGALVLQPYSRGTISLSMPDPFYAPRIQPNYFADERDMDTLLKGVKLARKILAAPAFDRLRGKEYLPGDAAQSDEELREHIRNTGDTLYHPVGTCKMGPENDPSSVVDSNLRLRGVDGVRVVDASVMPVIPRGNTNAPTLMIAEKAADLILRGF
jgi:choline dehydrogenase